MRRTSPFIALDSTTVHLAQLRGHPVIINFWATTCPPCVYEMPALGERFRAHRADGLVVLAVNGEGEKESVIRRFAERLELPFLVLPDLRQRVMASYEVIQFPVTIFVDSAGVIRYRQDGPIQPGQLDAGLQAIMPKR